MVEFSVYNAQVNIFAIVTTVAEFVGGGVWPYYRVETFRLFSNPGLMKYITLTAQVLFIASTFYYIVNLLAVLKKDGFSEFTANKWNLADCVTIFLSIVAIGKNLNSILQFYTKNVDFYRFMGSKNLHRHGNEQRYRRDKRQRLHQINCSFPNQ